MAVGGQDEGRVWIQWDVPEELGWDVLGLIVGLWLAEQLRLDSDASDRWEGEGGAVRG
jgi:hypothetical protein